MLAAGIADWAAIVGHPAAPAEELAIAGGQPASRHFVMGVVLGQGATLPIAASGVVVLGWGVSGPYWFVAGVVLSFVVALNGAWILLAYRPLPVNRFCGWFREPKKT